MEKRVTHSMEKTKKMNLIGQLLLFLATLAWGTSFVILKDTIEQVPPMFVIAIRFLFAGVIMALVFFKKLKVADKYSIVSGVLVGLTVAGAYIAQTYGLTMTTPGKNAFITSSYCVMCPFLAWLIIKQKPKAKNIISALLCILGIGLIALSGEKASSSSTLLGDALTLVSAVFFAVQIVFIDKFQSKGARSIVLLIFEFLTAGIIFAIVTLVFEMPVWTIEKYALNGQELLKIGYLALSCTLFAQSAQLIGQKYTTANQSALILSLEAVFGMLFSVIMGVEKLSLTLGIGFFIVFISILISELTFGKKLNNKKL